MIAAGVIAALHIGKIAPAIPVLQQALGLTLVEAGFLLSMVQLAGMLLGVLLGLAADGLGLRRSMVIGQLTLCAASLAGLWARAPVELLLLRAVEGVGFLLVVLAAPSLIRQLVPQRQLSSFLGLWGAYMPAGTALALLGGPLFMAAWSWQAWWGLLGALSGAMAAWLVRGVPDDRARAGMPAPARAAAHLRHNLRLTLTSRGPWLVALAFAMYSSQWLAVVGFLPSVYARAGVGAAAAGALTALVCAANIIGNVAAGRLLRQGPRAQRLLYLGFGGMALAAWLAFGPVLGDAPGLRYAAVWLFSAAGGMVPATLFSLVVRLAPNAQTVSTTMGWVQQCSAAGQFLGPPLVAWLAARAGGWHVTWVVTGVAALAGLWLASRLGREAPGSSLPAAPPGR